MKLFIQYTCCWVFIILVLTRTDINAAPGSGFNFYTTVYHIPLRIHLGESDRPPEQWIPILQEINSIWFSQAGICFTIHTVPHDQEMKKGLDLWFKSTIPRWNGLFYDLNDMHVRDDPNLSPALNPAKSSAARTAAHELGHALGLDHRQDSDDNLMRSKTFGWHLDKDEIIQAREAAVELASFVTTEAACSAPRLHTTP